MLLTGSPLVDAERAFARASRARRRAALLARLLRRKDNLGLAVLDSSCMRAAASVPAVREIAITAISGTVEPARAMLFDGRFRPTRAARARWQRVWLAEHRGVPLPPIDLVRVYATPTPSATAITACPSQRSPAGPSRSMPWSNSAAAPVHRLRTAFISPEHGLAYPRLTAVSIRPEPRRRSSATPRSSASMRCLTSRLSSQNPQLAQSRRGSSCTAGVSLNGAKVNPGAGQPLAESLDEHWLHVEHADAPARERHGGRAPPCRSQFSARRQRHCPFVNLLQEPCVGGVTGRGVVGRVRRVRASRGR